MEIKKYAKAYESLLFDLLVDEGNDGEITMDKQAVTSILRRLKQV